MSGSVSGPVKPAVAAAAATATAAVHEEEKEEEEAYERMGVEERGASGYLPAEVPAGGECVQSDNFRVWRETREQDHQQMNRPQAL